MTHPSPGEVIEMRPKRPGFCQRIVLSADAQSVRYRTEINGMNYGHTTVSLDEWRREMGGEAVEAKGQASLFGEIK